MKEKLPGLFDLVFHFEELPKDGDPLVLLNAVIPWEEFRPLLKKIRKTNDAGRGRVRERYPRRECALKT
ncbi:hypothetical protein [Leptospira santarosai]|uniref:hypothetical protein n=1 Tax=Leptospira santarosai TaxID=28183 RepID=UPI0006283D23